MTAPLSPDEGVRAALEAAEKAFGRLVDPDAKYVGAEIRLPADSHGDAIRRLDDARRALAMIRAALSTPVPVIPMGTGDADDAYEIGKRDGYENAIQDIDCLTGGDGEYTCVLGSDINGRHCPDADSMKARIAERFEGLPRGSASAAEGEPVAWFYEFLGHNDQWIADVRLAKPKAPSGGAIRNVRPLSFASALPSPLPSQGEPTQEMIQAGLEAYQTENVKEASLNGKVARIYRAMVSAAPEGETHG